jgi:hypothetical protein
LQTRNTHFIDASHNIHHTGIVDQHGQPAKAVSGFENRQHIRLDADIAFNGNGVATRRSDLGHQTVGGPFIGHVIDHHRQATRRENARTGPTDATATAGDNGNGTRRRCCHV